MTLSEPNIGVYVVFVVAASVELYFFMMQRSALEISRASGIDVREGRRMLPFWYLFVWLTKFGKWATAVYIGLGISWLVAIGLLAE